MVYTDIVTGLFAAKKVSEILQNLANSLGSWGNIIVLILGIAMLIVGVYKLAKALISHGQGQPPNWFIIIGLLLLGGLFIGTSIGGVADMVNTGDANDILNGSTSLNKDTTGWDNRGN